MPGLWVLPPAGQGVSETRAADRPTDKQRVALCVSSAPPLLKINPDCNAELQFFPFCLRKGVGSGSYRARPAKRVAASYYSFQLKTILTFVEYCHWGCNILCSICFTCE